jgi:farnesyl-diphosphate farnesyltransferase
LQAVNILKNRAEDLARGVDLFPQGWMQEEMDRYARQNLDAADAYLKTLGETPFRYFMKIPQALAYAILASLALDQSKLTRAEVSSLMEQFNGIPAM